MKVGLVFSFMDHPKKSGHLKVCFRENQLLVGGWFPNPFEKYAQVKLDHLPI